MLELLGLIQNLTKTRVLTIFEAEILHHPLTELTCKQICIMRVHYFTALIIATIGLALKENSPEILLINCTYLLQIFIHSATS